MADEIAGAPLKVLIVEDHGDTALSMAYLLRQEGHEVRIAPDGPSALLTADDWMPDVVLLDVGLPGMDGHGVATRLKERKLSKQPLIVAITGYSGDDELRRSALAGVDLHIVKPVEPKRLQQMLRRFQRLLAPTQPAELGDFA